MKRKRSFFATDMAAAARDLVFRLAELPPAAILYVAGWFTMHVKMTAAQRKQFLKLLGLKVEWSEEGLPIVRYCVPANPADVELARLLKCAKCGKPLVKMPQARELDAKEQAVLEHCFPDILTTKEVHP